MRRADSSGPRDAALQQNRKGYIIVKALHVIRNYILYCGIEKDAYNAIKKDAYVSNFNKHTARILPSSIGGEMNCGKYAPYCEEVPKHFHCVVPNN